MIDPECAESIEKILFQIFIFGVMVIFVLKTVLKTRKIKIGKIWKLLFFRFSKFRVFNEIFTTFQGWGRSASPSLWQGPQLCLIDIKFGILHILVGSINYVYIQKKRAPFPRVDMQTNIVTPPQKWSDYY